ncbi:MAG: LysM peptidoglycan-binding domain-containing protein [Xanthomonadales bacterium]|nr:LysM peptidoglycan-binding domain-containing protein [Xanthomonadales bacterium]
MADDSAYTVQRGDTLGRIAARYAAAQGVATNQMMVALQRENPRAFFADNINALKAGAVLRVPDADQVRALSTREATATVRAQNQAWAGTTALADAGAAPRRSSVPAAPAAVDDRLAIVPPRGEGGDSESAGRAGSDRGAAQMAQVEAELQRTREDLRSKDQEVSELASRIRDLEELNSRNARLLELKDAEVAELQRRLADVAQAPVPVAEAVAPPEPVVPVEAPIAVAPDEIQEAGMDPDDTAGWPTPGVDETADAGTDPVAGEFDASMPPVDTEQTGQVGPTEGEAFVDGEAPATVGEPEPVLPVAGSEPAEPAMTTAVEVPAAPAPLPRPWYMDPMVQGAIGLGVLALLLLAVLAGRQRRNAQAQVPVEAPRRSVADLFGKEGSAAPVAVAAPAVADGIEAEAQALEDQVAADPDDFGAHLELLSIYYAEGDRTRFEAAAMRFHARPGAATSAEWAQALDLGAELSPGHPLFAGAVQGSDLADAADVGEFGGAGWDEPESESAAASTRAPMEEPVRRVVDIGGTQFPAEPDVYEEVLEPDAPAIDFQPTPIEELDLAPVTPAPATDAADQEDDEEALPPLTFGGNFEKVDSVSAEPEITFEGETMDASDSVDEGAGMDEAATKLELARAYLDMGDPEGARAMLEEVLGEGDTSQREEARKLLATL